MRYTEGSKFRKLSFPDPFGYGEEFCPVFPPRHHTLKALLDNLPDTVDSVYIFGSSLRLNSSVCSDLDVFILGVLEKEDYYNIYRAIPEGESLDLLVETTDNFLRNLEENYSPVYRYVYEGGIKSMNAGKPNDRGLLLIAKANITAAARDLEVSDEIWVNMALFNVVSAAEKTIKYLCSCNGIDYDYTPHVIFLAEKLVAKGVLIPELVINSLHDYGKWATNSRYTSSQLLMKSVVQKHLDCVKQWISTVEKRLSVF